jgi:hypothetical protein
MADEPTFKTRKLSEVGLSRVEENNNKNPSKRTGHGREQGSVQDSPLRLVKESTSEEHEFKDRAISFLRSISTGSPKTIPKSGPSIEPFVLGASDLNPSLGFKRTEQEELEICKVQAWVTSGVIKKSFQHCIESKFTPAWPWIDLNEYLGRIIPSPIKEQLNTEFREKHFELDPKLTLSKLVNLREDLIEKVWKTCEFDPVTLAIGFSLFDRLLNMNLVNKINRKLYAAVCVLIAFKFIEETHLEETGRKMRELLTQLYRMDKNDLLTTKLILEAEFSVYAYLGFSLHLEFEDIKENLFYIESRLRQSL